jgi:hypothetical protein
VARLRKTVVVSLGTHIVYMAEMVNAFLQAFLTSFPNGIQILWKLKGKHEWDSLIDSKLDGRLWIGPSPIPMSS